MRDYLLKFLLAIWLITPFIICLVAFHLHELVTERRRFNEMYRVVHYGQLKGTKAGDCR